MPRPTRPRPSPEGTVGIEDMPARLLAPPGGYVPGEDSHARLVAWRADLAAWQAEHCTNYTLTERSAERRRRHTTQGDAR